MSITSNLFMIFVLVGLLIYYLVPQKIQWIALLVISYVFYVWDSPAGTIFLILSTLISYGAAIWIEKVQQNTEDKKKAKKTSKQILILGLLLNLGMLAVLKYTNFFIGNINAITKGNISLLHLVLPMGISYYTFQSLGYVLDVYWKRQKAEKNVFKYALFVSFFPYMIQGPISRFGQLAEQLYSKHPFELHNIKYGLERAVWGFFKKMVLADWAAVYADAIFGNPDTYSGIAIFGVLLYSVELYGNFSGGIDIIIGVSKMFGIDMAENFTRPFFATSVTDFWHRWHITLGTWMKDYVFYPLSLSKAMKKCGKVSKNIFGKKVGRNIPICISNLIVFFIVGIWHGPTWNNIGWGLYNGVIIAFSGLFGDQYKQVKSALHLNDKSKGYHVFMIIRTFIIMNISWYFDCVDSVEKAFRMMKYSVTQFAPSQFLTISSGKLGTAFTPYALTILCVGVVILFIVSLLQERGMKMRDTLSKTPFALQFIVFLVLLLCIPLFGPMAMARGFIYAQF